MVIGYESSSRMRWPKDIKRKADARRLILATWLVLGTWLCAVLLVVTDSNAADDPKKLPGGSGMLVVPKFQVVTTYSGKGTCKRGGSCSFAVDVSNMGADAYQGKITITDRMFNKTVGLKLNGYTPSPPWTCKTESLGRFRCNHPSVNLKPGASLARLTLEFHLPSKLPKVLSAIENCARVSATGMGIPTQWACAKAPLSTLAQPDLEISHWAHGGKCNQTNCTFRIKVKNTSATPYEGPIYLYQYIQNKPGKIDFFGLKPAWSCAQTAFIPTGNIILCAHRPVTLNQGKDVTLTIRMQFPITPVQVKSCTGIRWPLADKVDTVRTFASVLIALKLHGYYGGDNDGAIPTTGPTPDLSSAINAYLKQEWSIEGNGKITPQLLDWLFPGSSGEESDGYPANDGPSCISSPSPSVVEIEGQTNWGKAFTRWLMGFAGPHGYAGAWYEFPHIIAKAIGAPGCYWPFCSFFEFTAINDGSTPYAGPLNLHIHLPENSHFPDFRVTRSPLGCPAEEWSCELPDGRAGSVLICRHPVCALEPGEQTAIRTDGTLLPGWNEPPREEMAKNACGIVNWEVPPYKVFDIEQIGGSRSVEACYTTRIFPGRREDR